jgi:ribosomal protein S18 acetylase RimI-like enzyme
MADEILLRPGTKADIDFLFHLKKSTLKDYVSQVWGWDEKYQYRRHLEKVNPETYYIIQASGTDIGCMEIEASQDSLFLSVIEILPSFQNRGIGTYLIQKLLTQGKQEGKNVNLQVLKVNGRAIQLYKSLGFTVIEENETHLKMCFKIS